VFSKKQWKGPNGKAFRMPKSEGEIYMASGFTAREFGLGLGSRLTPAVREEINESHRRGKAYLSTADAELIKGSSKKADFPEMYVTRVLLSSEVEFSMRAIEIVLMLNSNLKMQSTPFLQYSPISNVFSCSTSRRAIPR
jgi:hypothetical protein